VGVKVVLETKNKLYRRRQQHKLSDFIFLSPLHDHKGLNAKINSVNWLFEKINMVSSIGAGILYHFSKRWESG